MAKTFTLCGLLADVPFASSPCRFRVEWLLAVADRVDAELPGEAGDKLAAIARAAAARLVGDAIESVAGASLPSPVVSAGWASPHNAALAGESGRDSQS